MNERLHVALLLAVTMLVFGNTLLNSFTLDDGVYILSNSAVTGPSVRGLFEPDKTNHIFRPVTFATFALNWAVGGAQPFGYHLLNLLLHAAVILLLYLVLRTLLEPLPRAATAALAAAWLFAVHPIHTEAVASIVGRSELLAAGFLLVAWAPTPARPAYPCAGLSCAGTAVEGIGRGLPPAGTRGRLCAPYVWIPPTRRLKTY